MWLKYGIEGGLKTIFYNNRMQHYFGLIFIKVHLSTQFIIFNKNSPQMQWKLYVFIYNSVTFHNIFIFWL